MADIDKSAHCRGTGIAAVKRQSAWGDRYGRACQFRLDVRQHTSVRRLPELLRVLVVALCLAGSAWSAGAAAPEPAVLDVARVPYVRDDGRAAYRRFLLSNLPRAMAISPAGQYGWHGAAKSIQDARERALASCAAKGASDCVIYAEDLHIADQPAPPPPPGSLIETRSYAIVPDARYFWYGPAAARGIFVWGHGKNSYADSRGRQPQAHVRAFNNAGFDVVRFDRDPNSDYADDAAGWLRSALTELRTRGWRQIIVGGQSRGAWNSLQMLAYPGLADVVVAISPASLISGAPQVQDAEVYRLVHSAASPAARVVVAQFTDDIFVHTLADRGTLFRDALPGRVGQFLLIDRPVGLNGHSAGESWKFTESFGVCIFTFVTASPGEAVCPGEARVIASH